MNAFDETKHPRGQATNAGQFREKDNSAPTAVLDGTDADAKLGAETWTILANRVPDLENSIEKANRRLAKAGVDDQFSATTVTRMWEDEQGRPWAVADVTLNRPSIAVGPWRFDAQHEVTGSGGVISHFAGNATTCTRPDNMTCDHCGKTRARTKVFTVTNSDTGETKQIGGSCIDLFLGVKPEGLWAMSAEVGAEARDEFDDGAFQTAGGVSNAVDGDELMLATIRQIDEDGGAWVPKSRADYSNIATIEKVQSAWGSLVAADPTATERDEIANIRTWVQSLDGDSDYSSNLKQAFLAGEFGEVIVNRKHMALAASAVGSYRRAIEREKAADAKARIAERKVQEYAFPPGEKLKGKNLELTVLSSREGQDYGYGAPTHVTLMDDEGHVFYWKSSRSPGDSVDTPAGNGMNWWPRGGERIRIEGGTVKSNAVDDYTGDWQTVLTRVKVAPTAETLHAFDARMSKGSD